MISKFVGCAPYSKGEKFWVNGMPITDVWAGALCQPAGNIKQKRMIYFIRELLNVDDLGPFEYLYVKYQIKPQMH